MPTVSTWSARFEAHGLDGLNDKSGRGRKPSITEKKIERVVTDATRPPKNRKRWSVRSMGRHAGVSHSTVQRIWSKNGLKPHVVKKFKLSNDPEFEKKFWDVIGLYLDPPAKALVLCCDEKSQCQALERTQLGLPLAPKRPRTMTHDYTRHGTITLFAALDAMKGKLIARTEARHTRGGCHQIDLVNVLAPGRHCICSADKVAGRVGHGEAPQGRCGGERRRAPSGGQRTSMHAKRHTAAVRHHGEERPPKACIYVDATRASASAASSGTASASGQHPTVACVTSRRTALRLRRCCA